MAAVQAHRMPKVSSIAMDKAADKFNSREAWDQRCVRKPQTVSELISSRDFTCPNEYIVECPDSGIDYIEYTFSQQDEFTNTAVSFLASQLPLQSGPLKSHLLSLFWDRRL